MKKKKIAESIIIRVGGGIREVRREPEKAPEVLEPIETDAQFEQPEDLHSFHSDLESSSKLDKNKIIN